MIKKKNKFVAEKGITRINLDNDIVFNREIVSVSHEGIYGFETLRNSDYGKGFRMSTFPELIPFLYAASENRKIDVADEIIERFSYDWLVGDTSTLRFKEWVYVQDYPKTQKGKIYMDGEYLRGKLSRTEDGVAYSEDGSIRSVEYESFEKGDQTPGQLAVNTGLMALVKGKENAELFAKISEDLFKKYNHPHHFSISSDYEGETGIPAINPSTLFFNFGDDHQNCPVFIGSSYGILDKG